MKGVKRVSISEKMLIEKSQNGDIESFEKLIEEYQVLAYNIALKMASNKEDAKDMAQEALLKVYKSIKNFRFDSSFSTWLYRIVYNTCIDFIRKNSKIKTLSMDKPIETEEGSYKKEIMDNKELPDEAIEKKELKEAVQKAIKMLPDKYRIMVVLRDIHDFSYEEISEITELPLGTVKSRISRARSNLKEILSADMELYFGKEV